MTFRLTVAITGGRPDASVLVSSRGTCSSRCTYQIPEGRSITLTPNPRNHHSTWSGAGLNCRDGPGSDCTVVMTQNQTVTAAFDTIVDEP